MSKLTRLKNFFPVIYCQKYWFKLSRRRRVILILSSILLVVVLYPLISFISVSRSEIVLAALHRSFQKEIICHEACLSWRGEQAKHLLNALNRGEKRLARRAKKYFFAPFDKSSILTQELSFRQEILQLFKRTDLDSNQLNCFSEYLTKTTGEMSLKILIFNILPPVINNRSHLDYYFNFFKVSEALEIRLAALNALANSPSALNYLQPEDITFFKEAILNSATEQIWRQNLILLLGDYYLKFPQAIKEILLAVYGQRDLSDEISPAFAADIYNRFNGDDLKMPTISEAAWDEYYNY